MGSLNNWLGFSLSPNLTVDMQETSQSQTASTVATGSMVHSNVVQASIGFGRECYELHPSDNAPASLQMPEMTLRSDGSLYILDSFNRTTQNEDWHLKSLEHSRSMGAESDLQTHEHLINADLSMLVGGNSSSRYDHISSDREGPKLEDFLGGASLGGGHDYSDHSRSETPQTQTQSQTSTLENMYGATPTFGDGDHLAMKMIVPPDSRLNCFPAFDIADSELSSAANSSKRSEDQTLKPTASCVSAVHSSSLREPYDHQNSNDYLFPDCSLQLPQSSGVNNMNGLSMIKTWLRTHPSAPESKINYGSTCETMTTTTTTTTPKDGLDALTNIQTLSLSMTPSSQSSSLAIVAAAPPQNAILDNSSLSDQTKKRITPEKPTGPSEHALRKSIDTFGQRTSIYRGVTRHRWTGRYEAHLWDNSCRREGQTRKGRQVYLGGYDKEEKAARSYDLAALKYWGQTTTTNFPISNYEKELDEMKHMTRQEYVASLRRKSSGFSRGASIYRGVTRHHQHGRWQARIGRVAGNKDLYLGTFSTQEEAAEAYDIAAIKFRGLNAVTNFDMSRYDVKSIIASSTLPVGGHVKRLKEGEASDPSVDGRRTDHDQDSSTITSYPSAYANSASKTNGHEWPIIAFQQHAGQQRTSWCKQEQDNRNQDLQVQLHSLHHQKYVQQSSMMTANATVLHNLMSLQESAASAGVGETNNTVSTTGSLFSNISANNLAGNGTLLMSTPSMQSSAAVQTADNSRAVAPFSQNEQVTFRASANNYDNMLYAGDPFSRSVYYLPQHQQQSGVAKSNYIDSNPAICNNWMTPAPTQTLAPRPNLAVCHAPIFSIWSDP